MNLEELRKELRKVLDALEAYKLLKAEERTEEKRAEMRANMDKAKALESDIADAEAIEELRKRNPPKTNGEPPAQSGAAQVQDQPIYRGRDALGQQMVDIAAVAIGSGDVSSSRSRLEQVIRREEELAERRAAGTGGHIVGIASDGGWLLQGETGTDLFTNGFNNSEVLSRCQRRDIGTYQVVELIGIDETSRATGSRGGGIRVYTDDELAALTQSKTKFNKIKVEPKRLTGLYYASNEILQNAPLLTGEMNTLFDEEFSFKAQDLVINGTGAGQALGVLAAGCTVSQAKESGQTAATITYENLSKMWSRLNGRAGNAVWFINRDTNPQLDLLSIAVGTGGLEPRFVTYGADGLMRIKGAPVVEIEQCATLGTVGDIILADFSKYIVATKGGINSASSIHLKFDYNQTAFRFVWYMDGQPRLQSAITPYKGSNTVSPFVTLATRS